MDPNRSIWERPWVVGLVLALCVALHAPSLGWGFFADDWGQRLVLEQPEQHPTLRPWNLYDFGEVATTKDAYFEDAVFPWWTDASWKARFFRPVSSCVLWFDHALFGRFAPAHHAMGLAWHALFLLLAWRLFRALGLTSGLALLALAVLALEDGAGMTVGWIANRNSVVEGVFTAGALLCALRARQSGRMTSAFAALALALLAAGSKESGLAALLGCALFLGSGSRRALRLVGAASVLLALAYLAFLALAGYGVRCEFYPTPWGQPALWAQHVVGILCAGPLGTLGPFPVDALLLVPGGFWPLVVLCALGLALLARPWMRALRGLELGWILGLFALFSLLPQASAPPSDRLLYVPALGLAPISALMLVQLLCTASRWGRAAGWALVVSALPLSGLMLLARGSFMIGVSGDLNRVFLEAELERAPVTRRDVILLQSPSVLATLSPLAAWRYQTGERNTRFHALQLGRRGLRCTRIDERTLEIESLDQPFLELLFERVFLAGSPLPKGARYRTSAFECELLDDAPVARLRLRFEESLDAPRWEFLAWSDGRWRRTQVPRVGSPFVVAAGEPLRPLLP